MFGQETIAINGSIHKFNFVFPFLEFYKNTGIGLNLNFKSRS